MVSERGLGKKGERKRGTYEGRVGGDDVAHGAGAVSVIGGAGEGAKRGKDGGARQDVEKSGECKYVVRSLSR